MRRFFSTLALAALAVFPVSATAGSPALGEITVSTMPALATSSSLPYTLRFRSDGTAVYDGSVKGLGGHNGLSGHYEAPAPFDEVRALAETAHVCERPGLPLFRQATLMTSATNPRVLIYARCADGERVFDNSSGQDIPQLATSLRKIGATLKWRYLRLARYQTPVIFAQ